MAELIHAFWTLLFKGRPIGDEINFYFIPSKIACIGVNIGSEKGEMYELIEIKIETPQKILINFSFDFDVHHWFKNECWPAPRTRIIRMKDQGMPIQYETGRESNLFDAVSDI